MDLKFVNRKEIKLNKIQYRQNIIKNARYKSVDLRTETFAGVPILIRETIP